VRRVLGLLASLVKLIALVVFALLVVYILFTVFGRTRPTRGRHLWPIGHRP